ncbi:MAG: helix-turn-helix domain-containing protein [Clostridia bacterium]|nr:helix-turn-helix domain-containing protein [Clostridia bacterium]
MEKHLLEKLSKITDEEKMLLAGGNIDISEYTAGEDYIINAARVTRGVPYISQRPHTRFAPFPPHSHNFVEMVTVVKGEMTHIIDGRAVTLCCGDVLVMNKHITHSVKEAGLYDLGVNIIMSDAFFNAIMPELTNTVFSDFIRENSKLGGAGMFLHFSCKGQKQIENIIENLLFELTEYTQDNSIMTRTVTLLFKYLSLKNQKLLVDCTKYHTLSDKRKLEISEYIESSYRNATLTSLAAKMSISVPYLSKIVREYFGMNFKELLLEERIRRAAVLIKETDMPICSIINNVGYENDSYFHREFKKRMGETPLSMRKSARTK